MKLAIVSVEWLLTSKKSFLKYYQNLIQILLQVNVFYLIIKYSQLDKKKSIRVREGRIYIDRYVPLVSFASTAGFINSTFLVIRLRDGAS
jgi:hypothetical protein